jgi:ribosomal protein S18 acetylase RimI-like enzyme
MAQEPDVEIVYMGVAQVARGTGVANALLFQAAQIAGQRGARSLALAVDHRNAPARRLYARWGFAEFGVRDAWIATPCPTEV